MTRLSSSRSLAVALLASLIVACGGGGGEEEDSPPTTPTDGSPVTPTDDSPTLTVDGMVVNLGETRKIAVHVGEKITIVASEPVTDWGELSSSISCNLDWSPGVLAGATQFEITVKEGSRECDERCTFPEGNIDLQLLIEGSAPVAPAP